MKGKGKTVQKKASMTKKPKSETRNTLNFNTLVELCRQTHFELQNRAYHSVDIAMVVRNWLIGWYIVEFEQTGLDRADYGSKLIDRLAAQLKIRGASATNLRKFRQFYRTYPIQQTVSVEFAPCAVTTPSWQTLSVKLQKQFTLSWSHYIALLSLDNSEERRFYEIEAHNGAWSSRELERQIASSLFERLALSRNKEEIRTLARRGHTVTQPTDLIKDPVVLEFLDLKEEASYSESELETEIINKLGQFLLELGKGFLFEARQKRFTFDNDHFYVDLVFYNRLLRCYVLIDLKRGRLTHQDIGQMQMYVNYFDRYVKTDEELPTVGILLCHRKNDTLVELTLPEKANIFAPKYQLYLPSKEELKAELAKIEAEFDEEKEGKHG